MKKTFIPFFTLFPTLLFGKISFDNSDGSTKILRSIYPAVKAAKVPPEKKIYSKDFIQHSHITSGIQYEDATQTNLIDISVNVGMSKKPLGVKENVLCFAPRLMMYKKMPPQKAKPLPFFGAGVGYTSLVDHFDNQQDQSLQAGISMGIMYKTKTKADHVVQFDLFSTMKESIQKNQENKVLPKNMIEISYGADF